MFLYGLDRLQEHKVVCSILLFQQLSHEERRRVIAFFSSFRRGMASTCIYVAHISLETDTNFGNTVVTSSKRVKSSNKPHNFIKKLEEILKLEIPFRVPKTRAISAMLLGSLWGHGQIVARYIYGFRYGGLCT